MLLNRWPSRFSGYTATATFGDDSLQMVVWLFKIAAGASKVVAVMNDLIAYKRDHSRWMKVVLPITHR
jgi:hypothetical protein